MQQVDALLAYRHLKDTMQFPQGQTGRDLNPPPDHGADPQQPDLELQDLWGRGRIGHLWFSLGALWQMRVSGSLAPLKAMCSQPITKLIHSSSCSPGRARRRAD